MYDNSSVRAALRTRGVIGLPYTRVPCNNIDFFENRSVQPTQCGNFSDGFSAVSEV